MLTTEPRRRGATPALGEGSSARCACRNGDRPCPRHAPNIYALWGAAHRLEGAST